LAFAQLLQKYSSLFVMDNEVLHQASSLNKTSSSALQDRSSSTPERNRPSFLVSPRSSSHANSTAIANSFIRSPLKPVLTPVEGIKPSPKNRNGTMILLSPSRTIADSLTALASSTAQQLEQVWDEVGYNPEERASQLSDLLRQFRNLCDDKITEERSIADTFRTEIKSAREELQKIGKALKQLIDPQLLRENIIGYSLTDHLAALEASLDALRSAAETARKDLMDCQQYLIEAHEALGWELEKEWMDIESDWTVERRKAFHNKVAEVKQHVSTRSDAVVALVRDCQNLFHELRVNTEESELDNRIACSLARAKDGSYILTSKLETDTCVGIGPKVLEDLSHRAAQLMAERKRRKAQLQEMGTEIAILWEKLHISEEEQIRFTQRVQGLGEDTMEKGQDELNRLRLLKEEMLGKLIVEARERIKVLWIETNTPKDQQVMFTPFSIDSEDLWDDVLLDKHDDYIVALESRLEQMKPILRIIERRQEILRERMEYEALQHNSERLQQRGAALTKQLMREEKMAMRIKKELPKLTFLLVEKLIEWKNEHAEEFQFGGSIYLEEMERQEEEWKRYKEEESKSKRIKKQEERSQVENRFGGQKSLQKGKKLPGAKSKPLGLSN
jgi:Ase1/PRC1/MAP65 family protein